MLAPHTFQYEYAARFRSASSHTISLNAISYESQIYLMGNGEDSSFSKRVMEATGAYAPAIVDSVHEAGDASILYLGPNEWLILHTSREAGEIIQDLRHALGEIYFAASDVSDSRVVISLKGKNSWQLLKTLCPEDINQGTWSAGKCRSCLCVDHNILIWQKSNEPEFRLLMPRPYADYFSALMIDTATHLADITDE